MSKGLLHFSLPASKCIFFSFLLVRLHLVVRVGFRSFVAVYVLPKLFLRFPSFPPLLLLALLSERATEWMFLPRVLVVGRKAGGVGGLCDFGANDLFQGVDALALVVESVHQMHLVGVFLDLAFWGKEWSGN